MNLSNPHSRPRGRRRRRWPRVGTLLAAIALVPLMVVLAGSWSSYRSAVDTRARSAHAATAGERSVRLGRLIVALGTERVWASSEEILRTSGVDGASIDQLASLRREQTRTAEAEVDRVVDELAVDSLSRVVAEARRTTGGERRDEAYAIAASKVRDEFEAALAAYVTSTTGSGVDAADNLERTTRVAGVLVTAVDRLSIVDAAEAELSAAGAVGLSSASMELEDDIRVLRDRWADDPRQIDTIEKLLGIPGVADLIAGARVDPGSGSDESADARAMNVDVGAVRATSEALVAAAGADVAAMAATSRSASEAVFSAALDRAVVSVLLSLIAVYIGTLMLVVPLRSLAAAAGKLRTQSPVPDRAIGGPREIRAIFDLLLDTSKHLDLLVEQSNALADGRLDAEVLDVEAPGGLGTAIQAGVTRLRDALGQQAILRRQLAHDAAHDALTELPNRASAFRHVSSALDRCRSKDELVAVLFIDLDHFKEVNDTLGHRVGDAVLITAGRRLRSEVRPSDLVGRLGGDEFVAVLEGVTSVEEAVAIAQRMIDVMAEPLTVGRSVVRVGASIGIAVTPGDRAVEDLVNDADCALYEAKRSGRGRLAVHNRVPADSDSG